MSNTTLTREAKLTAAKLARAEALAAHRAASAAVREAKSEANREAFRARPIRVSASAVHAVTGAKLNDGDTARGTVSEAHAVKFVSLRPIVGKRATFTREADTFLASVPAPRGTASAKLTAAKRAEATAAKRLASARAAVKRLSAKRPAKRSASA